MNTLYFLSPALKFCRVVFIALIALYANDMTAQLSARYTYAYNGGNTWAYNATPTILQASGSVGNDAVFTNQAIGFTFQYNCNSYTTIGISANGFIWFGTGTCATTQYTPLSSAVGETGTIDGIIAAFGANLAPHASGTRTLNTKLTGTAPNRVFTIEWRKAIMSGSASNPFDAQIKLFETTNKVEIRLWDSPYLISGANAVGQVGMRTSTADFLNRTTTAANLCTTTAGGANTATCSIVPTTSCNYAVSATSRAITFDYAFTGSCCTPPTTQASIGAYSNLSTSSVTVNWSNGNGAARVVVAHQTTAVSASPANGTDYTATQNAVFGSGANLGSNNYVVYQGTGTSVNVTGLTAGQTYHFSVFEYATAPSICYLTPGSASSQLIPLCFPPTVAASSLSTSNVTTTSTDVSWVRGDGDAGVIVVARLTATAAVLPVAGTTYTTTTFGSGSGSQLTGAGNYVVYIGTGTVVSVTGLLPSTSYTYTVYEYNSTGICYGSGASIAQVTASCSPSTDATAAVFSNILNTSLTLTFTRGSGSHVMVVGRATATANAAPVYNNTYAANAAFGSGATTGTGNFVLYNGTGNSVNVTALTQTTSYTFIIYEYNATPNCYSTTPLTAVAVTLNPTSGGGTATIPCSYTYSSTTGFSTITATAGRVLVASGAIDDANYPSQNITSMTNGSGFIFNYQGADYTSFGINSNGFIWFGSGTPATNTYSPIGSASANLGGSGTINGVIAACGADIVNHAYISLAPNPTQINAVVTGTAPNRVLTIEWSGFVSKAVAAAYTCNFALAYMDEARLDFQIKLYEKGGSVGNRIELAYKDQTPVCVFDAYNFQAGIRGASNADYLNRSKAAAGQMTTSSTAAGGTAAAVIAFSSTYISGNVVFRYDNTLSLPTVTPSAPTTNTCPSNTVLLSSTAATNYQWFMNGSLVPGPGSSSQTLAATQTGNYTVTASNGSCYVASAATAVTIVPCGVNITASAGANGSISPSGSVLVPYGTDQLFSFTPVCGYAAIDVIIDGISQGAMPSYNFVNVTVPHTIQVLFGVADEICGNASDDDCDGFVDEGCTANFNGDTPETAPLVSYSGNVTYPNCYPMTGDLNLGGDSPQSGLFTGPDGWYAFVAQSTGVTITMSGAAMDNAIGLYSKTGPTYILVDSENVNPAGVGGFERLTNNTLTPGVTYYVSVGAASGPVGGTYSLCIQHLMPSGCTYTVPPGGFSLCSNYKSVYRGSLSQGVSYDFHFTGVGGGASGTTSLTGTNGLIVLSNSTLGLRYGGIYNVEVDVNYALTNGAGAIENTLIAGNVLSPNCSNVIMRAQPATEVKFSQRCPASLLRSNWLIGTQVGTDPLACGAINYSYEFTQVVSCGNGNPTAPYVEYTTAGATPYLSLGVLPNLPNVGAWDVRVRPNFNYGVGVYGPVQRISVSGTSASAMLADESLSGAAVKMETEEIFSAIYPNPNRGDLININLTGLQSGGVDICMRNAIGQVVWQGYFAAEESLNVVVPFAQPLAQGMYSIECRSGERIIREQMVVTY